jgi:oligopeptidase B
MPPRARQIRKIITRHGDRRSDPWFWLREKDNPEVIDYLKAENAYVDAALADQQKFRDALYAEMLARIQETDEDVPYCYAGYHYYGRTVKGRQYRIYCRRRGSMRGREEVLLDLNQAAEGKKYLALGDFEVSPDGALLAYSLDDTGFREYTLAVKDLRRGTLLPERIEHVSSVAWAADSRTLFYVTEDAAKRPYRLYRRVLGATGTSQDEALLYEETDETFRLSIEDTRSGGYLILTSASYDASEVRVLPAGTPQGEFQLIAPRQSGHEYYVDHHERDFYIVTNDRGRNNRLVMAPVSSPQPAFWRQVIGHRKSVMLEDVDLFRSFMVVHERDAGVQKLRVIDWQARRDFHIDFPEASYSADGGANAQFDTRTYRLVYTSFVTPASVYDYDLDSSQRTLLKEQPVRGRYDRTRYATRSLKVRAKDGVQVPVSLVYRKDRCGDGPSPLLLYGYGSYGIALDVSFRTQRLSLLDRGVIFAIAHVRGGGDLGRLWHDDGKLMRKKNTFDDFIAVAEHLIARRITAPDRLVIQGGSAGGLLMGAVVNQRPELFKAVVSEVPFVDVLNTMLDASLPLTVGEYLEWGNPNEPAAYRYMREYSPYDNLRRGPYPAMLVETSLNDSQVMYWEPAKYVARLRTLKTNDTPLFLKTNLDAGHAGASGRYDYLKELAFTYAFILGQLGLAKKA